MAIKQIPLSQLEKDPRTALRDCCDSGEALVVEMPDHRLVSIQALEPGDDDDLVNELLTTNPEFAAMASKSAKSPRKPFLS